MNNRTKICDSSDVVNRGQNLLQNLFQKIHTEFLEYEYVTCSKSPAEIFHDAKRVFLVTWIYEEMLALVPDLSELQITAALDNNRLIDTCYRQWEQNPDMSVREFVRKFLTSQDKEAMCA